MIYFFDTSALQHRYVDGPKARGIRKTISDRRNECFICEFSVLEIAATLALQVRRNTLTVKEFKRRDQEFWKDVHGGKLTIRSTTKKDLLRARYLVRYAGVDRRKNIKSADALIAASCLEFALETGRDVTFCLEDWTLFQVVRDIDAFARVLRFRFIGTVKSP